MLLSPDAVLNRVAERMTDYEEGYEFELNSAEVVLASFNNALATISKLAPETFLTPKRVRLGVGEMLTIEDCEHVAQIPSIYVDNVYVSTPNNIAILNPQLRRISEKCKGTNNKDFKVQYVGIAGNNTIRVYPPIPEGVKVEADILCACTPYASSNTATVDVPRNILPVIEELMLYYLYDIDIEAVPNRARSSLHWQIATSLLGVNKNAPTAE